MLKHLLLLLLCFFVTDCLAEEQVNAEFPEIYNSETDLAGFLSPEDALSSLTLPPGFSATLFANEPQIQNPIAACVDSKGRVWVAENYTYAERVKRFDLNLNDRVVVLEDRDGDGAAEHRTVFFNSLKKLTGITVGQGGVWLTCPPELLFIPDADGDLVPDGPPQVVLDGFTVARENYHGFVNGLSWGPDNWLYGRCGASDPGEMGVPGSSPEERVPMRGGIWRFHPQSKVVEAITHGTTNPWGHDWNSVGELFFINTVNGHLWHAIPGAHFERPHTIDANPHIYELLDMHADHWHFDTGQGWNKSIGSAANDFGGGHAHAGMMIYQEKKWPKEYHGKLMTLNFHGLRINTERLERKGSGYVGRHDADFLFSSDTWFRGLDILPTPDGNALILDWSDTGECHDTTGVHRTSGRIFKIIYDKARSEKSERFAKFVAGDITALAEILTEGSEWESRQARLRLRELKLRGTNLQDATQILRKIFSGNQTSKVRLRALWNLVAIEAFSEQDLLTLLNAQDEHLRNWAVKLLADKWAIDTSDGSRPAIGGTPSDIVVLHRFVALAAEEKSAAVRLSLASTLQRIPYSQRPALAQALFQHPEDADDHNLPLIVWYGLTPLGNDHLQVLPELVANCPWPKTRQLIARRVADQIEDQPKPTNRLVAIASGSKPMVQQDIVLGIARALAGRRKISPPEGWAQLVASMSNTANAESKVALQDLNVLFGDGRAIAELTNIAADHNQTIEIRMSALQSLVHSRSSGLKELCLSLLSERYINKIAMEGLADESAPNIGDRLVKSYHRFSPEDRSQVISTLASRKSWAKKLLRSIAAGKIDRKEISPYQARQISNLNDEELDKDLAEHWGQIRKSPAERLRRIHDLKKKLTPERLSMADQAAGRALFDKNCAVCHTLFGAGGKLGPDLTGAQRANLDYLLENIVDPSAVVTKDFRAMVVLLDSGRVITGLVKSQTDREIIIATQDKTYHIPTDEIEEMQQSSMSTMPEGILAQMSDFEVCNLFAYLKSKAQVAP